MSSDMSDRLSSALADLEQSSSRLNQLTDEATDTLTRVEELLSKLSIGLSVSIPFSEHQSLEYSRVGNERKFGITVMDSRNRRRFHWGELSRDLKLEAITALPALILHLAGEIQQRVDKAEKAINDVAPILQNSPRRED